ncbi:hypothetical protein [Pseudomonas sp. MF6747]|uniref:hypothetical protein n=1 Tax=Pseudomonas sp. MF6747 TaxID=2797527 RepID=UPI00190DFFAC|nr:hypothetical protein [Pseudomonas sp. MF6747]MBK3510768.1 hypothetical protein [Pseudomonas sp. MF6747]
MTTNQTIDGVPRYIGEARIVGLYYPARCTKCGWLGSSADLTDEAECTRHEGDRLCLGYTEEVDAVYLLGVVQAMAKVAAQPQGEPVAWICHGPEGSGLAALQWSHLPTPPGLVRKIGLYAEQPALVATIALIVQAIHDIPEFPGITGIQIRQLAERLNVKSR